MVHMMSFIIVKGQGFKDSIYHEISLDNFLPCPSWSPSPSFPRSRSLANLI